MKIRYYLRGLGLGILVTAVFFMVSDKSSQTMSDEMIKARARELGMSESVVLSELATQVEETVPAEEEPDTVEEIMEETVTEEAQEASTVEEVTEAEEEESVEEPVSEEAVEEEFPAQETSSEEKTEEVVVESSSQVTSNSEPVVVAVNRGEGSDTVSRRLQEAGLVADAHEYDRYLMANGYDKRIGVGEHSIPAGATWEDIAKILCNMK